MSARHTPGPWTASDGAPARVIGADGQTIAHVFGSDGGTDLPKEANKALIAAAPLLFDAILARDAEDEHRSQCEFCNGPIGSDCIEYQRLHKRAKKLRAGALAAVRP